MTGYISFYTSYISGLQIIAFVRVESDYTPQLANALHSHQKNLKKLKKKVQSQQQKCRTGKYYKTRT